jgi:ABC-type branched-subunit amino acid transport system permease subunit
MGGPQAHGNSNPLNERNGLFADRQNKYLLVGCIFLHNGSVTTWKRALVVNVGALLGIGISLFVVSPRTPLWLFAILSVVSVAVLNYVCFGWRRTANGETGSSPSKSKVVICLGCLVLLLDLILRYVNR